MKVDILGARSLQEAITVKSSSGTLLVKHKCTFPYWGTLSFLLLSRRSFLLPALPSSGDISSTMSSLPPKSSISL